MSSPDRPPSHVFNGTNVASEDGTPHPLQGVQCSAVETLLHKVNGGPAMPGQALYNRLVAVPLRAAVVAYAKFWDDEEEAVMVFWRANGVFLDEDTLAIPAHATELDALQPGGPPDVVH